MRRTIVRHLGFWINQGGCSAKMESAGWASARLQIGNAMTKAQTYGLYFPLWNKTATAQGWIVRKGALIGTRLQAFGGPQVNELYQRIWTIAQERASAEVRGPVGDDFRHACHVVALGSDKSSSQLQNAELDRVLALFRLLSDPDDLSATLTWNNPDEEKRRRLLWWIKQNCIESYVVSVCRQKFATDDFESLPFARLRQLHLTLKNRSKSQTPVESNDPF